MELTELIRQQIKIVVVMAAAGVLTESLWQLRYLMQLRAKRFAAAIVWELLFWVSAATVISSFMYYCSFGRITFYGAAGFLAGLLLWKKNCCGIISAWVETDEAENSKTTAKSLTWRRQGVSVSKKGAPSGQNRKKKPALQRKRTREAKQLSETDVKEDV